LRGRAIGEHRQMTWGVVQARELEPGVRGRALLILRREGRGVAAFEILPNGGAMGRVVDDDEPPGLAQPYRGGKTRDVYQALQCPRRQRVASKASNVPPPDDQDAQACAKGLVEFHWVEGRGALDRRVHPASLNPVTKPP